MKAITCNEILPAICRLKNQFGILVRLDPNNRALALYLPPFDGEDEYCQQIVADGIGFVLFKTREDMQACFERMRQRKHVYYASECNNLGQYERNTWDALD